MNNSQYKIKYKHYIQDKLNMSSVSQNLNNESRSKKILLTITSSKFIMTVIVLVQLLIIYLVINPNALLQQASTNQLVEKILSAANVNEQEVPLAIGRIADNILLPDIEALKQNDPIQLEIYKDADNGDYVVLFPTRMIIFRESENRVIYSGPTPSEVSKQNSENLINNIITISRENSIVSEENSEIPIIRILDLDTLNILKQNNPAFYKDAIEGDVIAEFLLNQKIVIYRKDASEFINIGDINIE